MKLNVKLLEKVKAHILEKPRRFVMRTFIYRKEDAGMSVFMADGPETKFVKFEECGTAACIGGWAVLLNDGIDAKPLNLRQRAIKLIGLKSVTGDELFEVSFWPRQFREPYYAAKTQRTRAKVAAARIDHFIATKGTE